MAENDPIFLVDTLSKIIYKMKTLEQCTQEERGGTLSRKLIP